MPKRVQPLPALSFISNRKECDKQRNYHTKRCINSKFIWRPCLKRAIKSGKLSSEMCSVALPVLHTTCRSVKRLNRLDRGSECAEEWIEKLPEFKSIYNNSFYLSLHLFWHSVNVLGFFIYFIFFFSPSVVQPTGVWFCSHKVWSVITV